MKDLNSIISDRTKIPPEHHSFIRDRSVTASFDDRTKEIDMQNCFMP